MPFTLAHPAIILPLSRYSKFFSFSALVIGSLAPDFEYFLRFNITSTIGHTLFGAFIVDLPLVFVVSFIFHTVIIKPLLAHLPNLLNRSINFETGRRIDSFKACIIFTYSALIGIFSHFFWDAFTHADGLFVTHSELLRSTLVLNIPVYNFLQHASTVIGLAFIVIFFYRNSTERAMHTTTPKFFYWTAATAITLMLFMYVTISLYHGFSANNWSNHLVSLMSCSFIGVFLTSTAHTFKNLPDKTIS